MPEFASFRNQAEAKSPWSLDEDSRKGFAQSVNNNQPQMALYYAQEIIREHDSSIATLRAEIDRLRSDLSEKNPTPKVAATKKVTESAEA